MKITHRWLLDYLKPAKGYKEIPLEVVLKGLEALGLEVEEVTTYAYPGVYSGKIISAEPVKGSHKLQLCQVETRQGTKAIVCGAQNARAGLHVLVADIGTYLPHVGGGLTIEKRQVMGVPSEGMIVSYDELAISKDLVTLITQELKVEAQQPEDGIIELPSGTEVGVPAAEVLGLEDTVIDLTITPNLGHLLSVQSMARNLAWLGVGVFKPQGFPRLGVNIKGSLTEDHPLSSQSSLPPVFAILDIKAKICPKMALCALEGVNNKVPTPPLIAKRLVMTGRSLVNPVVDILNYVNISLNQPMHAYDAQALAATAKPTQAGVSAAVKTAQGAASVSYPEAGAPFLNLTFKLDRAPVNKVFLGQTKKPQGLEANGLVSSSPEGQARFEALDGNTYEVAGAPLITIGGVGQAIAGVIGAAASALTKESTSVVLESAFFNSSPIRSITQKLNLHTEAAYHFARGVNPEASNLALAEALNLITAACGGRVAAYSWHEDLSGGLPQRREFMLNVEEVNAVLGTSLEAAPMAALLNGSAESEKGSEGAFPGLAAQVQDERIVKVTVPAYRYDLETEADLAALIMVALGADKIKAQPLSLASPRAFNKPKLGSRDLGRAPTTFGLQVAVRKHLAALGLHETINMSFYAQPVHDLFGFKQKIELSNPISEDLAVMRASLVPSLVSSYINNRRLGHHSLKIFEVASCYNSLWESNLGVAGLLAGFGPAEANWRAQHGNSGYYSGVYDAKETLFSLLNSLNVDLSALRISTDMLPSYYNPFRSGAVCLGPKKVLGYFGELSLLILEEFKLKSSDKVALFELNLDALASLRPPKPKFTTQPQFMPLQQSFTVDVPIEVRAQASADIVAAIKAGVKASKLAADVDQVKLTDLYEVYKTEDHNSLPAEVSQQDPTNVREQRKSKATLTTIALTYSLTIFPRVQLKESEIQGLRDSIIRIITTKRPDLTIRLSEKN